MSASTMAEQGKKTQAKVLKALGRRTKTAQQVAETVGISRGMAARHLAELCGRNQASQTKEGRSVVYALPKASTEPGRPFPGERLK